MLLSIVPQRSTPVSLMTPPATTNTLDPTVAKTPHLRESAEGEENFLWIFRSGEVKMLYYHIAKNKGKAGETKVGDPSSSNQRISFHTLKRA